MYKKTIKYTDYNGKERQEDFYFYLNEVEVSEMETSVEGGFSAMIKRMIDAEDNAGLINAVKDLILKSYGIKSEDGRLFIKKPEYVEEFTQTPAYPALYMELATDANQASEFVNHIFPAKLIAQAEKAKVENLTAGNTPSKT